MYCIDQNKNKIRLLQSKKAKLSTFKSNEGTIKAIINCSFFATDYVIGRNQGDEKNEKPDQSNFNGNHIVILKDGTYKIGKFESWEYEDVVAGFSPCAIFKDGKLEIAPSLQDKWTPYNSINRTALCYNDDGFHFCVAQSTSYKEFASEIWEKYKPHFIAFLDSGGSSELIENGKLAFTPSDGKERTMFNGLAFIEDDEPTGIQKPIFPTKSTWVSQPMYNDYSHKGIKAIDFGKWKDESLIRLGLPLSYDYPIFAPFDCKIVYRDSISKGGGIALESVNKVLYSNGTLDYCTVWIGHSKDAPALGDKFKQNDLVCHFGNAGTKVKHMHLEVIQGKFSEIYDGKSIAVVKQKAGNVYKLENTIEPNLCLYFTEDTYVEDNPYDWKILKDEEESIDVLKAKIVVLENEIKEKDTNILELQTSLNEAENKLAITNDKLNRIGGIVNE